MKIASVRTYVRTTGGQKITQKRPHSNGIYAMPGLELVTFSGPCSFNLSHIRDGCVVIRGPSFVKFVVRVRSFFTELPFRARRFGVAGMWVHFAPPPSRPPHVVDSPEKNDLSTCSLFNLIPSRSEGVRNNLKIGKYLMPQTGILRL